MRAHAKIFSAIMAMMVIAPAYASHTDLGSQVFAAINFSDDQITSAEAVAVKTMTSNPGTLPDSPLYLLKRLAEGVRLVFAFDNSRKRDLHLEFAKTRLAEASAMADRNKTKETEKAVEEFNTELGLATEGIGRNVSAIAKDNMLDKSTLVLGLVMEKVPEEAKPAIQRAINNSIEKKIEIEAEDEEILESENPASEIEDLRTETRNSTSETINTTAQTAEKQRRFSRHMEQEKDRSDKMIRQMSDMEKNLEERNREEKEDDERESED